MSEIVEVIERLKKDISKSLCCGDITMVNIEDLEIVLNMLKEKDREIMKRGEQIIELQNKVISTKEYIETITQQRDYYKARYNALSKIVDLMAKHIYSLGYYDCLYEECDDNMDRECEDCIKEYFYKKVKETKDNGSTKKL